MLWYIQKAITEFARCRVETQCNSITKRSARERARSSEREKRESKALYIYMCVYWGGEHRGSLGLISNQRFIALRS